MSRRGTRLYREFVSLRRCDDGAWIVHYYNEGTGQRLSTACKEPRRAVDWACQFLRVRRIAKWDEGSVADTFLSKTVVRDADA
ncbi:MAG TPA: hypothetical protein VE781_08025 [Kineosporiaceae bacterium]|jgi:hypothetical protein|nr:hypothetical protein [Kineosporiaceae bacterium]